MNFTVVFLLAMVAPIALLAAASFASSRLSGGDMLRDFTIFGYALIPLDLAAHMAHNLFHLLGEGLAVPRSMVLWLGGTWEGSTALLNTMTIEVLQYLMLGAGIAATVYAAYRIAGSAHGKANVARARSAAPAHRAARGDQRLHVHAADGPSGVGRRATYEYRARVVHGRTGSPRGGGA